MDPGLCASCRFGEAVRTARSTFWRCGRWREAPERWPKYPPLPVRTCPGHEARPGP